MKYFDSICYNTHMQIDIKTNKLDLTPAITQYIEDKIGSLDKFITRFEGYGEAKATVEIARTTAHHQHGDVYYAEANLYVNGTFLRAEQTEEDIRAAIDKVKDILKMEIQKYKEKAEAKRLPEKKSSEE